MVRRWINNKMVINFGRWKMKLDKGLTVGAIFVDF